jgi:hypothetical protein
MEMYTVEIKGPGLVVSYPLEVIVKALKEAGLEVEVEDNHPTEDVDHLLRETKKAIDEGEIKGGKIKVKATHLPWGG